MDRQKQSRKPKLKISDMKEHRRKKKDSQAFPIDNDLFKKFKKFNSEQRSKELKKNLDTYFGKNHIGKYQPQYNFLQQWQGNKLHTKHKQFNMLQQTQFYYLMFSFVLMIVNIFTIWTISVERYFNTKLISNTTQIYLIQMALLTIKTIVNIAISSKKNIDQSFNISAIFKTDKTTFLCISYCLFMSVTDTNIILINIWQVIVMAILYQTSAKIYQNMKIMEYGLKYQNQIKILNLFSNIFIEAHLFALILYNASKIDIDENWVKSNNLLDRSPIAKYIYSFYYASTTMLTIGYGDITPVNIYQIMVNVLIQIVGVISFGYLVNEMGHTLGKMRSSTEQLERDLQTINKISKFYNLQKDLETKAKSFVINNQSKVQQPKLQDEDNLLMKLSEDLRQKINHENSLSVIKSSIFFLCNWSKNMQSLIAQRLKKHLYSPNEKLVFPNGIQRIFIIKVGKIQILMNKYSNSDEFKKVLKVIDAQRNQQVSDNIYGYTSIFSNRKASLEAMAKNFTATYSVDKNQFLECAKENKKDFQYYHEIKCRIDQTQHCQQYQTPSIMNIRQHYCPSRYIVIKKHKRDMQKFKDKRRVKKRKGLSKFKLILDIKLKNFYTLQDCLPERIETERTIQFTHQKILSANGLDTVQQQSDSQYSDENVDYTQETLNNLRLNNKQIQQMESNYNNILNFEKFCQYYNFFRNHNISRILSRIQTENFMEKEVK